MVRVLEGRILRLAPPIRAAIIAGRLEGALISNVERQALLPLWGSRLVVLEP
jgi:hypothetical protein